MHVTIIPCRGAGSRVRAVRDDGNKLLLDVSGEPAIVRQLEAVRPHTDAVLVETLPRFADAVRAAIGLDPRIVISADHPPEDHDGVALSLLYAMEAVERQEGLGARVTPETTVTALFSDTLLAGPADFAALTAPHVVGVKPVPDGAEYLNVEVDAGGHVVRWDDHPGVSRPALATIGVYTLPLATWLAELRRCVADRRRDQRSLNTYAFLFDLRVRAIPVEGWLDIGNEAAYRRTVEHFTR